MYIKDMVESLKNGEEKYLDVLVNMYYPKFLKKAYERKPDYYMPDRVKADVTNIILRYVNEGLKIKFTDYIKSIYRSYCNVSEKKFCTGLASSIDPLDEVEEDEYYINIIFSTLVNPSTNILTKEEKTQLSYMLYFYKKDCYYKGNMKTLFSVYIGNFINEFFKNSLNYRKEDKILTYYIYLIGITDKIKDRCNNIYIKMCKKYNYEYKYEEFIEFINQINVIYNRKISIIILSDKIEKFIAFKKKKYLEELIKDRKPNGNGYEYIKNRLFYEFKKSGIDENLLLEYINYKYDFITNEYNTKKDEISSSMQKYLNTRLKMALKKLIEKDEYSKNILKDLIVSNVSKINSDDKLQLLEEVRISILRDLYVSDLIYVSPKLLRETLIEEVQNIIYSDDTDLKTNKNI